MQNIENLEENEHGWLPPLPDMVNGLSFNHNLQITLADILAVFGAKVASRWAQLSPSEKNIEIEETHSAFEGHFNLHTSLNPITDEVENRLSNITDLDIKPGRILSDVLEEIQIRKRNGHLVVGNIDIDGVIIHHWPLFTELAEWKMVDGELVPKTFEELAQKLNGTFDINGLNELYELYKQGAIINFTTDRIVTRLGFINLFRSDLFEESIRKYYPGLGFHSGMHRSKGGDIKNLQLLVDDVANQIRQKQQQGEKISHVDVYLVSDVCSKDSSIVPTTNKKSDRGYEGKFFGRELRMLAELFPEINFHPIYRGLNPEYNS